MQKTSQLQVCSCSHVPGVSAQESLDSLDRCDLAEAYLHVSRSILFAERRSGSLVCITLQLNYM